MVDTGTPKYTGPRAPSDLCMDFENSHNQSSKSRVYLFFFFFYSSNFIFKLYIIVLVLPNIKMNPPQVYMCSPSRTLLPPPSPTSLLVLKTLDLCSPCQFSYVCSSVYIYSKMQAIGIIVQNPNSMCSTGVPAPNGAHLAGRPQEARQTGRVDLRDDGSISGAAPLTP